jgi:hypothetical protein
MFCVPKKDGGFRIVQDFRGLNAVSIDDRYSMKDIHEIISDIGQSGSRIFSTMDLTSGYWQMPLSPESRQYTAFTVPGVGQFEWVVSPMGLLGCSASFQRMMESVVFDLQNVMVYIDDLGAHSKTHEEHLVLLQQLFDRLRTAGIKANLKKCFFGAESVAYLGFRLTKDGILPGFDKLAALEKLPPPKDILEVRQFVGLANFFRNHVRNFAKVSGPLTALTSKKSTWKGGELPADAMVAYKEVRQALLTEPVLAYPDKNRDYCLIVDASTGDGTHRGGLGAILTQKDDKGEHHVICYASRQLLTHEKNYTPYMIEMQAACWGMDTFHYHLKGKMFTLITDHKPLEALNKQHLKTMNNIMMKLQDYPFVIEYKKGSEMPADFFSRQPLAAIEIWDTNIGQQQREDGDLNAIIKYLEKDELPQEPKMKAWVTKMAKDSFLEDGQLWRRLERHGYETRTVLWAPSKHRSDIVQQSHGHVLTGHGGVNRTTDRILESFYWPNIQKDVELHLKHCHECQVREPVN